MLMSADSNTVDCVDAEIITNKLKNDFNLDNFRLNKLGDNFILTTNQKTVGTYKTPFPRLDGKELSISTIELNTNNDCTFLLPVSNIEILYSGKNVLQIFCSYYANNYLENVNIKSNGNLDVSSYTMNFGHFYAHNTMTLNDVSYVLGAQLTADTIIFNVFSFITFSKVKINCNKLQINESTDNINYFIRFVTRFLNRQPNVIISNKKLIAELAKHCHFELEKFPTKIIYTNNKITYTFTLDKNTYKIVK